MTKCFQHPELDRPYCAMHGTVPDHSTELPGYEGPVGWVCSAGGLFEEDEIVLVPEYVADHQESRPTSSEDAVRAAFTVDGKPITEYLRPDAPTGSLAQDVLHAIALEFGWRTDWTCGSPITLQAVLDEIRKSGHR